MKVRYLLFLSILTAGSGCTSSLSSNSNFNFTNADAAYKANVSGIYELNSTTSSAWSGIDIGWKDSTGTVRALSGYAGKVVLLSFWATLPPDASADEFSLDSTQSDLGDSVRIVTVAEDNSFQTVYNYVAANKISVQVVVDSGTQAHIQYASIEVGSLALPETFVLKPYGSIMTAELGNESPHRLDSLVRAAYK
jgi:hypothetical protein